MKSVGIGLLVLVLVASGAGAGVTTNVLDAEVRVAGDAALRRGVAWLERQQAKDGGLGGAEYPAAVTALAVSAMKAGGSTNLAVLTKAQDYVKQAMAKSSNDWTGSFSMTICQTAVGGKRPARDQAEWAKERRRLDRDREYSVRARESELRQRAWAKERAELEKKGVDADQKRAADLAQSVTAGFEYRPTSESAAGGRRGYGSLTQEGRFGLLYEDVHEADPRVDAYLDWAQRGWSLDENPGRGNNGLYFFYHGLAKCLAAGGEEVIQPLEGGAEIRWREALIRKLCALQRKDEPSQGGYWVNDNTSYLEGDQVLVTAYAVLALREVMR